MAAAGRSPLWTYGTNSRPFTIGNHLNRKLDIKLGEVAVYDKALTAERIRAHYQAGHEGS